MRLRCGQRKLNRLLSTPTTFGPSATDFTYSLSLPKFNLPGKTLTGATIYFFAEGTITTLSLQNTASGAETFTFSVPSTVTFNSSNSANNADKFVGETIGLFSQAMILGGNTTPACPFATHSAGCSTVAFTPPGLTSTNLGLGFTTGTGGDGLTGVIKSIVGGDLANYTGAGTFTLGGSTKTGETFIGGGGNVQAVVDTQAEFSAEIDYTYTTPSGTPEPTTMALMGGALLGLGFLRKRFKKS